MCVCVLVVIPLILDVRLVDVPARVTLEEGHTGFIIHLPSAVLAYLQIIFVLWESEGKYTPINLIGTAWHRTVNRFLDV